MNILWMIAQNVYIISDFNIFSEQDVNAASQHMTGPYDHHHSGFRFTRNADARIHSYRPLVRTKTFRIAMLSHSDENPVRRKFLRNTSGAYHHITWSTYERVSLIYSVYTPNGLAKYRYIIT
jgi:preprotein translocase subunit Sec63